MNSELLDSALLARFLGAGEGVVYDALEMPVRVLVSGDQTGGSLTLLEILVPPGAGSPPHMHSREDETFYILEGGLEFDLEGERLVAGAGCSLFGPRGRMHCFQNRGTETARVLVVATPGGIEHFFSELAGLGPEALPAQVIASCEKYGMTLGG